VETLPAAFTSFGRKPLKLGIHDDLIARGGAPDVITKGLESYCSSTGYLNATKAGTARIDLDGNAAGMSPPTRPSTQPKNWERRERAKAVVANAAKAAREQATAAEKKVQAQPPAQAQRATVSTPKPPAGPVTRRSPVVVVRKRGRSGPGR
jgi:sRNA-binding protein